MADLYERPRADTTHDHCVVCPYCGYEHGDAWEHCHSDQPVKFTCNNCERRYEQWAEYDVRYHARRIASTMKEGGE